MLDVIAIGELLADIAFTGENDSGFPIMEANPGGAPANYLAALSAFGLKTAMLANVGNDTFGTLLTGALTKAGISTEGITRDNDAFTTLAFVQIDKNGERSFSFARKPGADTRIRLDAKGMSLIDAARLLHFGSLSLTDEPARSATMEAVAYARSKGKLVSFDPNLRAPLWGDLACAKDAMLYGMQNADIVKLSDDEAVFLFDMQLEACIQTLLNEYGVKLVFLTLGKNGCVYGNKKAYGHVDAIKPKLPVVDTTGAGDIFFGSAIYGVLSYNRAPESLDDTELRRLTKYACAAAGISITKRGGITSVPCIEQVNALISEEV